MGRERYRCPTCGAAVGTRMFIVTPAVKREMLDALERAEAPERQLYAVRATLIGPLQPPTPFEAAALDDGAGPDDPRLNRLGLVWLAVDTLY